MSTPAQILANTANAQASCGPRTESGRATSSKNAITLGLFTTSDFVRPGEETQYAELSAALTRDLAPIGALEENLAGEIRRAMWRLRRCAHVEGDLVICLDSGRDCIFDPMETVNSDAEKIQKSVDRARAQAHRLLHRCTAELRALQTERQFRNRCVESGADTSLLGVCDLRAVLRAVARPAARAERLNPPQAASPESGSFCNSTQTPRNAQCPCGSGQKFKRCCGRNAPAVLHAA